MSQKSTYSKAKETEYDRRTKKERAKEKARMAETDRRDTLTAVAKEEVDRIVAETVAESMKGTNGAPPDTAKLAEESEARLAQRGVDLSVYEEKMARANQLIKNFYSFSKSATKAFLEFAELTNDMAPIARRLQKPNPIRSSVMGVTDGTGIIQDHLAHTDAVWTKFMQLYRAESGVIDRDTWERLP